MKTTKGGKVMNPTDAYRKELRRKELKRNKKERKKVREVGILKKDPEAIKEQIQKLEIMKADGALDKSRKHKKRQLEDTLNLVLKKRKEYEEKMREKGEAPVMFSHLGPPKRRTTADEDERAKHPKPEDSVYYHPTLNPTGAPPPGKPPMYKSSIGPRIPLPSGAEASSSNTEIEEGLTVPPPPPPPQLPAASDMTSLDDSAVPSSIPLPPPPGPPKLNSENISVLLPPPPPGPPPKEPNAASLILLRPPPPPVRQMLQPPPPGTKENESDSNKTTATIGLKDSDRSISMVPPPPPPPGLPPRAVNHQLYTTSEPTSSDSPGSIDNPKLAALLPPPAGHAPLQRPTLVHPLQPEMLPPAISRFPPPPPPDLRPPMVVPGLPNRPPPPPPPGIVPPSVFRPPFAAPPALPGVISTIAGLPTPQEDDPAAFRPSAPQKPSYVKSAASTVVKRPLAQHTPELTAMVPASVRVRRETATSKPKPKPHTLATISAVKPSAPVTIGRPEPCAASSAPKATSIDDSYMAFMEDMKALGALDS